MVLFTKVSACDVSMSSVKPSVRSVVCRYLQSSIRCVLSRLNTTSLRSWQDQFKLTFQRSPHFTSPSSCSCSFRMSRILFTECNRPMWVMRLRFYVDHPTDETLNVGQTLVKRGSNVGQTWVKRRSNVGQTRVVLHSECTNLSTSAKPLLGATPRWQV
jgi:hypothetical protein